MAITSNKQYVINMWKSFSSRERAKIETFLSQDAIWIAPKHNTTAKFPGVPSGMVGRAEIVRFLVEQFPTCFARDVKHDVKGVYGDGEIVVVEATLSATIANGRAYKNDYCFIHCVERRKSRRNARIHGHV
jgi:uncharacterized protein